MAEIGSEGKANEVPAAELRFDANCAKTFATSSLQSVNGVGYICPGSGNRESEFSISVPWAANGKPTRCSTSRAQEDSTGSVIGPTFVRRAARRSNSSREW